jgi:hypothetical protein
MRWYRARRFADLAADQSFDAPRRGAGKKVKTKFTMPIDDFH